MASLYKRKGSNLWWIKWRNPATGKVTRESTGLKTDVVADTRQARELKAKRALDELRNSRHSATASWDSWVPGFIRDKYSESKTTFASYTGCWRSLSAWLEDIGVIHPGTLTREHCMGYPAWRKTTRAFCYKAGHNTALHELKVMRLIMSEAVRRGYCAVNTCSQLELRKTPVKEKPEISPAEEQTIRDEIAKLQDGEAKDFMEASFEIAIRQGCRLRETCVALADIDEDAGTIRFVQKGKREHVTLLHGELVPFVKRWRAERRTHTYNPKFTRIGGSPAVNPTLMWSAFFRRIGLGHICFHCTRVTVASRMARANVHEAKAMRYVGHASTTIHRLYQRLRVEDLRDCVSAVLPGGAAGKHP